MSRTHTDSYLPFCFVSRVTEDIDLAIFICAVTHEDGSIIRAGARLRIAGLSNREQLRHICQMRQMGFTIFKAHSHRAKAKRFVVNSLISLRCLNGSPEPQIQIQIFLSDSDLDTSDS